MQFLTVKNVASVKDETAAHFVEQRFGIGHAEFLPLSDEHQGISAIGCVIHVGRIGHSVAEAALTHERMLAIGEIGLDYHYDFSPRGVQRDCFDAQLALAGALNKPVIIHDREAHGDCMDLLRLHRAHLSGVMHCFSASWEIAKECIDLGLYIAFGGALTFKNAVHQWDIASRLPLDRLLIETDCPYMTPVPLRGRRNDPSRIVYTLDKLAELRGADREELAETLYRNGLTAFGIRE